MPTYALPLEGRVDRRIKLRFEEASAMLDRGFRFSIFRPQEDIFNLSIPYEVTQDRERGTLTFFQGEPR